MSKLIAVILMLFFTISVHAQLIRPDAGTVKKYIDAAPQCIQRTPHGIPNYSGGNFVNKCNFPVRVYFNQVGIPDFGGKPEDGLHRLGHFRGGFLLRANQSPNEPYTATNDLKYGSVKYAFCVGGTATSQTTWDTVFKNQKGGDSSSGVDANAIVNDEYKCWYSY